MLRLCENQDQPKRENTAFYTELKVPSYGTYFATVEKNFSLDFQLGCLVTESRVFFPKSYISRKLSEKSIQLIGL